MMPAHPRSTLFPYTTLFRSIECINSRSLGAPGSSCAGAENCRVSRFGLRRACFFAFRRMSKSSSAARDTLAKVEAGMNRAQANHFGLLVCANDLVQRFRGPAFKAFDRTYRFTDMWMDRGG